MSLQEGVDTFKIGSFETVFGQHAMAHLGTAPFRIMARLGLLMESCNEDGVSTWVEGPHKLAMYTMHTHPKVTIVALVMVVLVCSPLFLVDLVLATPGLCYMVMAAVAMSFMWSRNRKEKQL